MPKGRVARIDTDIEYSRRPEVIQYITKKYGAGNVCRIVTFGTMAAKMVLKDVGRVLGETPGYTAKLANAIPTAPGMTIAKALEMSPEFKSLYETDPRAKEIIDIGKRLEGNKRHSSQHACFDEKTLITTETGVKRISDVKKGERVLTHTGQFKEVVDTIVTKANTTYIVRCYGAKPVEVTGNHPLLVKHQTSIPQRIEGKKTRIRTLSESEWKAVCDLEKDDYIGIPINKAEITPDIPELPTSEPAFWWIVGRYVGDGWTELYHRTEVSPNHAERRIIICCSKEQHEVDDITSHLKQCGFCYRIEDSRTTKKIFLEPQKILYDYLQKFGRYANGKFLPADVINLPVSLAKAFLDGYQSADGSYNVASGIYSVKTVSEKLAMGVSLLVNKVYHVATGFSIHPPRVDIIEGRAVNAKTSYSLTFITGEKTRKKYFFEDGCLWVRLKSVERKEVEEKSMYNLTVSDDHSYQANGFAAHNCGLVISPSAVSDFLPTSMEIDKETKEKGLTSQVTMSEVEELSLIKMDLLGLKTMGVIHEVVDTVQRNYGKEAVLKQIGSARDEFHYQDIPLNDRKVYQMLAKGDTGAVFQLESGGMTKLITQMFADIDTLPDDRLGECFERLIAAVALYRPGPMDYIPNYLDGMKDVHNIKYLTPELEDILRPTYGVIVYQEQVMQIVQKLAGYTLGRADVVRKAMGKKKHKIMDAEKVVFIHGNKSAFEAGKDPNYAPGCVANGIPEDVATEIWSQMESFASYAFNRSHAACYAFLSCITAYMRCYWPAEFYAAMCNAFIANSDSLRSYLSQASHLGLKLLSPDVNKSDELFVSENGAIRFGLGGISGIKGQAGEIVGEREKNGEYKSVANLFNRMAERESMLTKTVIEGLVYSGALSSFSQNKNSLLQVFPILQKSYKATATDRALGQISMFGDQEEEEEISLPDAPAMDNNTELRKEQEVLGVFLSGHPAQELAPILASNKDGKTLEELSGSGEKKYVRTGGMIREPRVFYTKKNEKMAVFQLESQFSSLSCVVFPSNLIGCEEFIQDQAVVLVDGSYVKDRSGEGMQFLVNSIEPKQAYQEMTNPFVVTIHSKAEQQVVLDYIKKYPGPHRVVLRGNGKEVELKSGVNMTLATLNYLSGEFQKNISA